ncbi:MAG TPA: hypothetical protein VGT60_01300 [Candidatus Limnocylindria bacterium]|nr:hypothetical protein [Candidatus Limnocylindria bacterium]
MPSDVLLVGIATLGVTLAGFAGVVAVFRADDTWTDVHAFRLRVLVRNSLGVMFMALLPLVYLAGLEDDRAAIGAASGTAAAWMALTVFQLQRQWLRIHGGSRNPANVISSALAVLATVLFALNAVSLDRAWPYVVALCLVLLTAALAFQRMIGVRR